MIVNRGSVRGGNNDYARLHLHIIPTEVKSDSELLALFESWTEEFGLKAGCEGLEFGTHALSCEGCWWRINTRREFALVPAMIRKALKSHFDIGISMWDVFSDDKPYSYKGLIRHNDTPEDFWMELTLAQAWYGNAS